jgi:prepilin-type N-terminal cleavage/methylation domain-containing protein
MRKRLLRRLRNEDGFGLIELMIALVILSIAIAGLMGIFMAGAFSLARAGQRGTATVIMDRTFEYYRRAPWGAIRLVQHGPGNSGGRLDSNVTGDAQYSTQCSACPAGASNSYVDESASTNDEFGSDTPSNGLQPNNITTCNAGLTNPDPNIDSTAPITNCLAITTVNGADNKPYRVYTYMKYACIKTPFDSTHVYGSGDSVKYNGSYYVSSQNFNKGNTPPSALWWTLQGSCVPDYKTKVVTIIVRLLKADGVTLKDTANGGMLAKQTVTFSYASYTTGV